MTNNVIPKISVLMPVYNCRQYIEESVNSIITQTFTDFEFLIIDDCSTDGTFEYLKSLTDARITLIRKSQNTGYTVSLNMGLQIAKGEYIARMDGDDISFPDRFAKQVTFMDKNREVVLCGGGYRVIGSDIKFMPKTSNDEIVLDLLSFSPIAHPTVFIRNEILKKHNIKYNTSYEPAEDYKLWTILSEFGEIVNLDEIILSYRIHSNQTSNLRSNAQFELGKLISREYIESLSRGNIIVDQFCNSELNSPEDLKKYEQVEELLKSGLKERGIIINHQFFMERKKRYLKLSLNSKRKDIQQAIRNWNLLRKTRLILGNTYIIKYLVKCIMHKN